MQIHVNTDRNIVGHEALAARVRGVVEGALSQFSDRITRVEIHLSDENGPRNGQPDKRCLIETRLGGRQPIAVTHQAATLDRAVDGAASEMARLIRDTLKRQRDQERRRTDPPPPGSTITEP